MTPTYTDDNGNYSLSSGKKNLIAQHAHMILEYDSDTNSATYDHFLVRNPWGGNDSSGYMAEWWMTYEEMYGTNLQTIVAISEPASAPASKKVFNYTITSDSNSATSNGAKKEGETITFTITRDGTGEESVVYLSTVSGTADANDYQEYSKPN